jgi:hypothetical protein
MRPSLTRILSATKFKRHNMSTEHNMTIIFFYQGAIALVGHDLLIIEDS